MSWTGLTDPRRSGRWTAAKLVDDDARSDRDDAQLEKCPEPLDPVLLGDSRLRYRSARPGAQRAERGKNEAQANAAPCGDCHGHGIKNGPPQATAGSEIQRSRDHEPGGGEDHDRGRARVGSVRQGPPAWCCRSVLRAASRAVAVGAGLLEQQCHLRGMSRGPSGVRHLAPHGNRFARRAATLAHPGKHRAYGARRVFKSLAEENRVGHRTHDFPSHTGLEDPAHLH
jgi:hypothetical protein